MTRSYTKPRFTSWIAGCLPKPVHRSRATCLSHEEGLSHKRAKDVELPVTWDFFSPQASSPPQSHAPPPESPYGKRIHYPLRSALSSSRIRGKVNVRLGLTLPQPFATAFLVASSSGPLKEKRWTFARSLARAKVFSIHGTLWVSKATCILRTLPQLPALKRHPYHAPSSSPWAHRRMSSTWKQRRASNRVLECITRQFCWWW